MKLLILLIPLIILLISCNESSSVTNNDTAAPPEIIEESEKIIIVDRTGKEWDITHAVNAYGFRAERFDYGLGPFAIKPIQDPRMLSVGDIGYPTPDLNTNIIGTILNGDTRAYPLDVLVSHEIVNDQFGDSYVSVAY
jgi:hypothetical protein